MILAVTHLEVCSRTPVFFTLCIADWVRSLGGISNINLGCSQADGIICFLKTATI